MRVCKVLRRERGGVSCGRGAQVASDSVRHSDGLVDRRRWSRERETWRCPMLSRPVWRLRSGPTLAVAMLAPLGLGAEWYAYL